MHKEIKSVLKTSEFMRAAEGLGVIVVGGTPAEFAQRVNADAALVANLGKAANLRMDN